MLELQSCNALEMAARHDHVAVVKFLVQHAYGDANTVDSTAALTSALRVAARNRSTATLTFLLADSRTNVNAQVNYAVRS